MYKILSRSELKIFIKKHFNVNDEFPKLINKVACIKCNGAHEYLINDKFMIKIYK